MTRHALPLLAAGQKLTACVAAAAALSFAPAAHAQSSDATTDAAADEGSTAAIGKGVVGGAMLGAELVMAVEAAAGARPWWAYLIGGTLGAVGGGVGGYFIQDATDEPGVAMGLLVGGFALAIPTTVLVLTQSSKPPRKSMDGVPVEVSSPTSRRPTALVALQRGRFELGAPDVRVGSAYTRTQIEVYGASAEPEVHVPLFQARF